MGVSVARWGERRSIGKALDPDDLGGSNGSMRGWSTRGWAVCCPIKIAAERLVKAVECTVVDLKIGDSPFSEVEDLEMKSELSLFGS